MLNLKSLELPPELLATAKPAKTERLKKRENIFIRTPFIWWEKLSGYQGQTLAVALYIIHLDWKAQGRPVKLANGALDSYGIGRRTKWRALTELERLGLISVERRVGKSPIIRILQA
jgi:hypothetical protein